MKVWCLAVDPSNCINVPFPDKGTFSVPQHYNANNWRASDFHDYTDVLISKASQLPKLALASSLYNSIHQMMVYAQHLSMSVLCGSHLTKHLCGMINIPSQYNLQDTNWNIQGISGYYIDLFFEHFAITFSKQCHVNSLALSKYKNHRELYCGHLPDWYESCPCNMVYVVLKVTNYNVTTSFLMYYKMNRKRNLSLQMRSGSRQYGQHNLLWGFDHMQDIYQMVILHIFARTRIYLLGISRKFYVGERAIHAGKSSPSDQQKTLPSTA